MSNEEAYSILGVSPQEEKKYSLEDLGFTLGESEEIEGVECNTVSLSSDLMGILTNSGAYSELDELFSNDEVAQSIANALNINLSLYIDGETSLPKKLSMNLDESDFSFLNDYISSDNVDTALTMSVDKTSLEVVFDYDNVSTIEVPEEALDAASVDVGDIGFLQDDQVTDISEVENTEGDIMEQELKVGKDIKAGEYLLKARDEYGYVGIYTNSDMEDCVLADSFSSNYIVTLVNGDFVSLYSCDIEEYTEDTVVDTTKEGMFKVGKDIKAGTISLKAEDPTNKEENCYWCLYTDSRESSIIDNGFFAEETSITVEDGQYLLLSRCVMG